MSAPPAPPVLLDAGPRAVLVELADLAAVMGAAAALRDRPLPGMVDVVPAMRTVLITFERAEHVDRAAILSRCSGEQAVTATDPLVVIISVRYDGIDLATVAAATGRSVAEVIDLHTAPTYTAAFCGFQPGWAYLVGLDPVLHLPRHTVPRPRVDAGSVAIASEFTGIYPNPSPGGWHLLGHTDAVLWDDARVPPALLAPGTAVRFEAR